MWNAVENDIITATISQRNIVFPESHLIYHFRINLIK